MQCMVFIRLVIGMISAMEKLRLVDYIVPACVVWCEQERKHQTWLIKCMLCSYEGSLRSK